MNAIIEKIEAIIKDKKERLDWNYELEVDAFEDGDEDDGIWLCYHALNKRKAEAEPCVKLCGLGELDNQTIIGICNKHRLAYCL